MLQFFIPPVKSKDPLLFLTFRSNLRLPARIDFPKPEPDELKLAFPALCDVSNQKHCGNAKEKKLEQFDSKCHLMPIPTCTTTQLRTSGRLYLKMMEEMLTPRFATDIRKETLERNIRKETSEKGIRKEVCIFIFSKLFSCILLEKRWRASAGPRGTPPVQLDNIFSTRKPDDLSLTSQRWAR